MTRTWITVLLVIFAILVPEPRMCADFIAADVQWPEAGNRDTCPSEQTAGVLRIPVNVPVLR